MSDNNDGRILVGFCLDESGSMGEIQQKTIEGFNEYINDLRKQEGETRLSLTMFSDRGHSAETFRPFTSAAELSTVEPLTTSTYKPHGNTPLYDAIGFTINELDTWLAKEAQKWTVLFVIQTDGLENASREYTRQQVFDLIRSKEAEGWKFIYLGADQDAYTAEQAGRAMGMSVGSTMSYDKDASAVAYASLSGSTGRLRTNSSRSSAEVAADTKREYDERLKEEEERNTPSSKPNF